jgi:putative restriction endonuclease
VQTSAASPYADVHDPEAGHFVYKYRGSDPAHADNVALRRAMEHQRSLLYLVAVDPGAYDAIFPVYVVGDDPARLQFTLVADQIGARTISTDVIRESARREYVTRAVMQRLHQAQFRRVVLRAYRERCAICRLKHVELLDAAHILPDRHPLGEPTVSNGLGLCKIHHSAFDVHILGIDPDARVHVRADVLEEVDGPMLRYGLQQAHGSRLVLPRRDGDRPNREFLAERFERFRAA